MKHSEDIQVAKLSGFATLSPKMALASNYPKWIADYFRPWIAGDALEVGLGYANYRNFYHVDRFTGCDIDPQVVSAANKLLPEDAFFVSDMAAENFINQALQANQQRYFDCVISFNALQYVESEHQAISNLLGVLKPNGYLCLLVPANPFLYGPLDIQSGHRYRYSREVLLRAVDRSLARVVSLEQFNCVGALGWWASNIASKLKTSDDNDQDQQDGSILFFDKYLVPVSKFLQPLTKRFFGLSYALVLQRVN